MSKPPKVVPIQEPKYKLIARDPEARRLILGIGSKRIAVDFFSRISKLPPATGGQPAELLPMKQNKGTRRHKEDPRLPALRDRLTTKGELSRGRREQETQGLTLPKTET